MDSSLFPLPSIPSRCILQHSTQLNKVTTDTYGYSTCSFVTLQGLAATYLPRLEQEDASTDVARSQLCTASLTQTVTRMSVLGSSRYTQ